MPMICRKVNTNLSETLDEIGLQKIKRDDYAKCILADPQVLARIVKNVVTEFEQMSVEEILPCIGEPIVTLSVPELLSIKNLSVGTEDIEEENGKIVYDIRFPLYHKEKTIKFLINIEAQKSTKVSKLKYHIENRITYYISRMISSQKNVEFINSSYDDLKPVYSIWICMDTGKEEDSIIKLGMGADVIYGESRWKPDFSLINGAIIRIRENGDAEVSKNKLIAMLELLFSQTPKEIKKKKLEEDYNFVMSAEMEGCVSDMCNISDLFEEQITERVTEQVTERVTEQVTERVKEQTLISKVVKKIKRGKNIAEIADELEETVEAVTPVYEAAIKAAPDYDEAAIYEALKK